MNFSLFEELPKVLMANKVQSHMKDVNCYFVNTVELLQNI